MKEACWHALYVKSRSEKKVAELLSRKGFEIFCPTVTTLKQWSDRKKKVQEPLFRSYVFLKFNEATKLDALQTAGVVAVVNWLGKPAIIREEEVQAIRAFLQDYEDVKLVQQQSFEKGGRAHVDFGPMNGSEGEILRQSRHKVVLRIDQLGMNLVAEIPKSHLRALV